MRILIALVLLAATAAAQLPGNIKVAVEDDWHYHHIPAGREIEVEVHATVEGNKFSIAELSAGIEYGRRGLFEFVPERVLSTKYIVRTMNGMSMIDVKIKAIFLVPTYYPEHQLTWYVDSLHPKTRRKEGAAAQIGTIEKRKR